MERLEKRTTWQPLMRDAWFRARAPAMLEKLQAPL